LKGHGDQEGFLRTGRGQMSHPIIGKENLGNYSLVSVTAVIGKVRQKRSPRSSFQTGEGEGGDGE